MMAHVPGPLLFIWETQMECWGPGFSLDLDLAVKAIWEGNQWHLSSSFLSPSLHRSFSLSPLLSVTVPVRKVSQLYEKKNKQYVKEWSWRGTEDI